MPQSTTLFVGRDVHKDSISVAHAEAQRTDPPHLFRCALFTSVRGAMSRISNGISMGVWDDAPFPPWDASWN